MEMKRDNKGRFKRKNAVWTPQNMNNGYIDNNGRFRVYLPNHPRASSNGYVLRAIVHYEYYYNEKVTKEFDVHHIDKNRLNDTKKNLKKLSHIDHARLHNKKVLITKICEVCGKKFDILAWRLKEKGKNRGKYCSQKCYHKRKVSKKTKDKISESHKINGWSKKFKFCINCRSIKYPHVGKGLCKKCYQIIYRGGHL